MNNDTILDNRWRYTDMKLRDYLKIYKKINSRTQDNIQDIFNSIDFEYTDLSKPISNSQRKKLTANLLLILLTNSLMRAIL